MKLLIGASSSKIFHLKEFAKKLEEYHIETKVVSDIEENKKDNSTENSQEISPDNKEDKKDNS